MPAALSCEVAIQIARTVVTKVQPFGGALLHQAQPDIPMTISVAAMILGIARQTIRNTLSTHKHLFDVLEYPYMPNGERIITPRDLQTLRELYPLRRTVKGGPSSGK